MTLSMQTRSESRTSSVTQDAKEIIQFEHVDHDLCAEEQRKLKVNTLKCQTEVKAKIHVEEDKAAEIKNNV